MLKRMRRTSLWAAAVRSLADVPLVMKSIGCAATLMVGACSPSASTQGDDGGGACPAAVIYEGRTYYGTPLDRDYPKTTPLGWGVISPCMDEPSGTEKDGEQVRVREIRGVDPRVAIILPTAQEPTIFLLKDVEPGELPHEVSVLLR